MKREFRKDNLYEILNQQGNVHFLAICLEDVSFDESEQRGSIEFTDTIYKFNVRKQYIGNTIISL